VVVVVMTMGSVRDGAKGDLRAGKKVIAFVEERPQTCGYFGQEEEGHQAPGDKPECGCKQH
jgi:hypothetical protein